MRAFITGICGFAGRHLKFHLESQGVEVWGADLAKSGDPRIFPGDLSNREWFFPLLEKINPDVLFHLAASTSVGNSWKAPGETLENNFTVTLRLLEWMRQRENPPKLLLMGSAEVYGRRRTFPLREELVPRPLNPYAFSKFQAEESALFYHRNFHLPVFLIRAFNFTGPGQSPVFVVPSFAKRIAAIERGEVSPTLEVGNLEARRDFSDVRDVVRALDLVVSKGTPGRVYNVCSGNSLRIADLLGRLLSLARRDIRFTSKAEKFRPNDIPRLEGSRERITEECGWNPSIPLQKTLEDTLDYWRLQKQV